MTSVIDPRCKCPMAISLVGDGCRYCQPQEYIDRLEEWLSEADENEEWYDPHTKRPKYGEEVIGELRNGTVCAIEIHHDGDGPYYARANHNIGTGLPVKRWRYMPKGETP